MNQGLNCSKEPDSDRSEALPTRSIRFYGGEVKTLPPYAKLLKLRTEEQVDGLRFVMPFHDDVVGRPGFLHGGAIAGLLEFAAFTALSRAIGEDVVKKPITVTVDYMRGGTPRDTFAEARIERLGKRMANVESYAWQGDRDRPIASARINFLLDRS